jgi:hypothetical protein
MLTNILKFLSLGDKSNDQVQSNILEILSSDLDKKKNIKKLEKWACNEYLTISDGINEKKYKIVLLSFIFNLNKIYIDSMPKLEKQIEEISDFLSRKNIGLGKLSNLFCEKPGEIISHSDLQNYMDDKKYFYTQSLNLLTNIFSHNSDNLVICKKLYEDFSSLGLLGRSLTNNAVGAKFLLLLQDDKLSEKDIEMFKNGLNYLNDNISRVKEINPPFMNDDIYNRIILNENNPENLKLLLEYCNSTEILGKISNSNNIHNCSIIREMLNTKIEYVEMKSEMDKTPFSNTTNNRKPKI